MEHTDRNRASADLFPFADAEDTYWRNEFRTRPYVRPGSSYDEYRDAYRYGWESRAARSEPGPATSDLGVTVICAAPRDRPLTPRALKAIRRQPKLLVVMEQPVATGMPAGSRKE